MKPVSISLSQARRTILGAQGLQRAFPFGAGAPSVTKTIEHLGYVQLDTISIVQRAHHHILRTRIPTYDPTWLDKAQYQRRKVFEYWAHAASYLPLRDYRFALPVMEVFRSKKDRWPQTSAADMKKVLDRIRVDGPLKSRDFESTHKSGNWWDWKPDKWALQRLFLEGHLMVSHREGFQRVYDLPERILPNDTNTKMPSIEEYYRFLITTTLNAQGLATSSEISHLRKTDADIFQKVLRDLILEKIILPVKVDSTKTYYAIPQIVEKTIRLQDKIHILSPFDNLVIWRKRLKDIFGFDYTLECYIPSSKRVYGYFCLPVLYKDQFLGRIDAKADRAKKSLIILQEFWEQSPKAIGRSSMYQEALRDYAVFNECLYVKSGKGILPDFSI